MSGIVARAAVAASLLLLAACGGGGGSSAAGGGATTAAAPAPTPAPTPPAVITTPIGVSQFTTIDFNAPDNYAATLPVHFGGQGVAALDNTPANNRVDNRIATLGRVLFHDPRLSTTNAIACASCHDQANGFSDPRRFSVGVTGQAFASAHAMRLANVTYYQPGSMFWDRRAATLELQTSQPILNAQEMGWANAGGVAALLTRMEASPYYPDLFLWAFGTTGITEARMQLALAQFMRAMVSTNSLWDSGVVSAFNANPNNPFNVDLPNFTAQQNRGRQLFMAPPNAPGGGAGCSACHVPPTFALAANSQSNGLDAGETRIFKSPSLRNAGITGPFMHDGRFATLEEVVTFYDSGVQNGPALDNRLRQGGAPQRLNLNAADRAALAAFMRTLTDPVLIADRRFSSPFR